MWRRGGAAVVSVPEQDVVGELVALAGYRFDLSTEIPIRAQIYSVAARAACGGDCGAPHRF